MKSRQDKKNIAVLLLLASLMFFIMGFMYPLLQSGYGLGPIILKRDYFYLWSSFRFFFSKGEVFIGLILLFFTIIFPALKYITLFVTLLGKQQHRQKAVNTIMDIINKWAMLDVFVVALLLLNLKFDSAIIITQLQSGTTLFAISILLMMTCSFITGKYLHEQDQPK